MKILVIKLKNNLKKGLAPYEAADARSGFVILFAVTISSIILAISLGVADIALKEIRFSASARDTNDAFFAADSGIECALYYDKPAPGPNRFVTPNPGAPAVSCASAAPVFSSDANGWYYNFTVLTLGGAGKSCALVRVSKNNVISPPNIITTVNSKGYNLGGDGSCASSSLNLVERSVQLSY